MDDIRDVKGLLEIPAPPPYEIWAVLTIGFLLLVILLVVLLKRKKSPVSLTPAERALAALEDLEPLLKRDSAEPFADAVARVIRNYVYERFGISAPRKTTEEFLSQLNPVSSTQLAPYSEELGKFLRICDATKFGGREIDSDKRLCLLNSARQFIQVTTSEPQEKEEPPLDVSIQTYPNPA